MSTHAGDYTGQRGGDPGHQEEESRFQGLPETRRGEVRGRRPDCCAANISWSGVCLTFLNAGKMRRCCFATYLVQALLARPLPFAGQAWVLRHC